MTGTGRYGYFRYGEIEHESAESRPRLHRGAETDGVSAEEALGAGIALKTTEHEGYDWDFVIGADGGFASTTGLDEYAKDMAWATADEAYDLLGAHMTPDAVADLEIAIESVIRSDPRTFSVESIGVAQGRDPDTLRIAAEFTVASGRRHAVIFPVPRR